jgi:uncharacterized protein (DUF433 family)
MQQFSLLHLELPWQTGGRMAQLDWSQCPAVESIPGKVSGAWVLKGTRMPVQTIFENLEAGLSVKEITEVFDVTEEEVKAVPAMLFGFIPQCCPDSSRTQCSASSEAPPVG